MTNESTAELIAPSAAPAAPAPTEVWTVQRLKLLGATHVYGWRRGAQYLYIGETHRGVTRIMDGSHQGVRRYDDALLPTDAIDLWAVPKGMRPVVLESLLIDAHRPLYNGVGRRCDRCRRDFQSERPRQRYCTPVCQKLAATYRANGRRRGVR